MKWPCTWMRTYHRERMREALFNWALGQGHWGCEIDSGCCCITGRSWNSHRHMFWWKIHSKKFKLVHFTSIQKWGTQAQCVQSAEEDEVCVCCIQKCRPCISEWAAQQNHAVASQAWQIKPTEKACRSSGSFFQLHFCCYCLWQRVGFFLLIPGFKEDWPAGLLITALWLHSQGLSVGVVSVSSIHHEAEECTQAVLTVANGRGKESPKCWIWAPCAQLLLLASSCKGRRPCVSALAGWDSGSYMAHIAYGLSVALRDYWGAFWHIPGK